MNLVMLDTAKLHLEWFVCICVHYTVFPVNAVQFVIRKKILFCAFYLKQLQCIDKCVILSKFY